MDRAVVTGLLEEVLAGRAGCTDPDRDVLTSALRALNRLRGFLDATEATIATALHHVSSFPEHTLATAARTDLHDAITTVERATTLAATPTLATTLATGDITTEPFLTQRDRLGSDSDSIRGVLAGCGW